MPARMRGFDLKTLNTAASSLHTSPFGQSAQGKSLPPHRLKKCTPTLESISPLL
jgi:hypothetical protein